jgi:UDP-N-acetylmuramyl pentapeptide phosphotransferase/UDP-N-acetylglucosamine-1-phosphate transferase
METESMAAFGLAGSALGFLVFNFGRAKIFMGDNGSTFIGFLFSFLAIRMLGSGTAVGSKASEFLLPLFPLLLPLGDMAKVVLWRIKRGYSPFRGDRTHIHHLVCALGFGHRGASLLLYGWHLAVIATGLFLAPEIRPTVSAILLPLLAFAPYVAIHLHGRTQRIRRDVPLETSGSV